MRPLIAILCALLTSSLMSRADEFRAQPNVRVWVQFIAIPYPTLTELLAEETRSDVELHRKVMALSRNGEAKILETGMVCGARGEKATVESVLEEIYPTEYDPPEIAWSSGKPNTKLKKFRHLEDMNWPRAINATAFETRNTGFTIEFEASIPSENRVTLRIVPEIVQRLHYQTWFELEDAWGKIESKFPIYEVWRGNQSVSLKSGAFGLLFALTPRGQVLPPHEDSRILVFVRADTLSPEP